MTACPCCGSQVNRAIQVTGGTIVDTFDVWVNGYETRAVKVVCVETKERNHAIFSTGRSTRQRQSPPAQPRAGNPPVPALPADLPAKAGQTEVPVLQEAAWQSAGEMKKG